ncbi:DNA-binding SARP family transcriptional activator [Allocatelliglobosispora scoriae]|uniref:DNA-binding SARP family transcriptional activator n=1 Tax=Allocatelliglobosispora scoriae TaxID=643052 RepID=A0A841BYG2_9ACTN|nr:bacterial transcriptional activator domain-containing protein [Allocatelliglobosispora scoriae]MBB5871963.1 DNA-binding SARP family transcriptional activator [Allocatelliglobosispora scoriae]
MPGQGGDDRLVVAAHHLHPPQQTDLLSLIGHRRGQGQAVAEDDRTAVAMAFDRGHRRPRSDIDRQSRPRNAHGGKSAGSWQLLSIGIVYAPGSGDCTDFANGERKQMGTIRTFIRFAWSLSATVAILAGSAYLLVRWAGWPLPDHFPTSDDASTFVDNPRAPAVVKAFAACIAWLLWLTLPTAIAIQAWAQRSRRATRLRLPRPIQVLTAGLFGVGALQLANPASAHDVSADAMAVERTEPHTPATTADSPDDAPGRVADAGSPHGARATDGVKVPGGWATWPLAGGILASSAAALLNGTQAHSASALVRGLRAAQHPSIDPATDLDQPTTVDDIALLEKDAATPAALTIAATDGRDLGVQALPRSGVGFTGPGADDAVRGLIAIAAVTTTPATVITTRGLLTRLASANVDLPNITAVDDPAQATHMVQMELGTRYAATGPPHAASTHPPMILITDPPVDDDQVSALAILGHSLGIYVVIHGHWAKGAAWQINHAGQATEDGANIGRLNTLSQAAIGELGQLFSPPPPSPQAGTTRPSHDGSALPLRLHILGMPRLITPSLTAPRLRRSGAWQIATYLALHPDGASRIDLIEQIFGDMRTIEAATTSLNTCLHELRRVLTVDGRSALLTIDGGYRLDHRQIDVDWWQLQTHLQRGELDSAVSLYEGPVAESYQWDWIPEHRQAARRTVAAAYSLLAGSADDPREALNLALAGIDVDPYAQDCYEAAIRAHLRAGNHNGAHMVLQDLRQRLSRTKAALQPSITNLTISDPNTSVIA